MLCFANDPLTYANPGGCLKYISALVLITKLSICCILVSGGGGSTLGESILALVSPRERILPSEKIKIILSKIVLI